MKYKLTDYRIITPDGKSLRQIQSVRNFRIDCWDISVGDLGGYVESESNLSQAGTCWIFPDAQVWGGAHVADDAVVRGSARISGTTRIIDHAIIWNTVMPGNATVGHYAKTFKGIVAGGYIFGSPIVGAPETEIVVNDSSDVIFITGLGASIIDATFFKTRQGVYINCRIDIGKAERVIDKIKKFDPKTADVLKGVQTLLEQ